MANTLRIIASLVEEFGPLIVLIVAIIIIQHRDKEHYKKILEEDHKDLENTVNNRMNSIEDSINSVHSQLVIITSVLITQNENHDPDMLNNYLSNIMNKNSQEKAYKKATTQPQEKDEGSR